MLDDNAKAQLRGYLGRLQHRVELVASLDDSATAVQMRELLDEIAAQSELVSVRHDGHAERRPSFQITRAGADTGIAFAAIPMGHEFTSLVLALLQAGGHPPKITDEVIEQIKALDGDYVFETWMSLTCHNCPDVVQALNVMAVLNPRVKHTAIDGGLFQAEVEERQILAVPTMLLNGQPFASGRLELSEILAKIDTGAAARDARKMAAKDVFDVLIIGGGPAGAAAAVYAARKGIHTGIVAERVGGQTLDTMGIENYISVLETQGPKFAAALEAHTRAYDVDIMAGQRVAGARASARAGRADHGAARERRGAEGQERRARHRRALEEGERARRGRVRQQGRRLLPALRRPALQGQGGGGDRRRQLGRRGGDRPGRHRRPRDARSSSPSISRPTRSW